MQVSKYDVSVLLLSFNSKKFIYQCLQSVRTQIMPHRMQLVIMDDHSTDDSIKEVERFLQTYQERFDNVVVYRQPTNKGCYLNLIDGLDKCEGEYIAYLECDDYWISTTKLQEQLAFLKANSMYIGIGTGCQFVDVTGTLIPQQYYRKDSPTVITYRDSWTYPQFQTSSFVFLNCNKLRLNSDLSFSQCNDKIMFEHLTKYKPIIYIPKKTTAYRMHGSNISSTRSKTSVYLHHIKVNSIFLKKNGITTVHLFCYSFLSLTFIWINDLISSYKSRVRRSN
jgi:glycosyltransferase involved in cell wall biosynthesis